ncbi:MULTISPECIES: aa3-type cytochrome c oxidase subunit IV [Roseobacteraceae]|jgi:uncharacterized membrane protein|uniref:Cytochrome c oxidase subunit 4 n=2 Tax=Falsiruegeria TaxID=2854184 RepID=A0A1Y5TMG4_9RHOB|nr:MULTISPECIES: aa3-type cytochrome c oxidase subunit IV [Roseobacteraceae]MBO9450997.1 aa3-type cytochrome c oxidase subunit IV [Tropicibacter sp. R16_0]SLN65662.1 Cytochrome c oxidase subunit 4 [Falsiruegeria litorea R37]SPJ27808.1 Cytochrome c oxidase subunit 4 [Falsiruegeria mediterranea M17]
MADHKHGEMDITDQTAMYNAFIKFCTWSCVVIFGILLFLAVFAS